MKIPKDNNAQLPRRFMARSCYPVLAISCAGLVVAMMGAPTLVLPLSIAFAASMISLCILEAADK